MRVPSWNGTGRLTRYYPKVSKFKPNKEAFVTILRNSYGDAKNAESSNE